jgi:anti-sigma B factor antagonist
MYCAQCGHVVPDGNNFCSRCGNPMSKNFSTTEEENVFIITARTENVDYTNHGELSSIFKRVMRKRVLIDLSDVKFIDSTGIGTIATLYYKTNRTKQEIVLVGIGAQVMRPIKALGVDNLFIIHETRDKAFAEWGISTS